VIESQPRPCVNYFSFLCVLPSTGQNGSRFVHLSAIVCDDTPFLPSRRTACSFRTSGVTFQPKIIQTLAGKKKSEGRESWGVERETCGKLNLSKASEMKTKGPRKREKVDSRTDAPHRQADRSKSYNQSDLVVSRACSSLKVRIEHS